VDERLGALKIAWKAALRLGPLLSAHPHRGSRNRCQGGRSECRNCEELKRSIDKL